MKIHNVSIIRICALGLAMLAGFSVNASPFSMITSTDDSGQIVVARSTFLKPTYSDLRVQRAERKKRSDMAAMEIRKESAADQGKGTERNATEDPSGRQNPTK